MAFFIAWTVISVIIGYLGSGRTGGFWGFFFFSFLLSPLIAALALALGGRGNGNLPSRRPTPQRPLMEVTGDGDTRLMSLGGLGARQSIAKVFGAWVIATVIFSLVYWTLFGLQWASLLQALQLSIQIGTLGFDVVTPTDAPTLMMNLAFAAQRVIVLTILVLTISRLVTSHQAAVTVPVLAAARDALTATRALEAQVFEQKKLLTEVLLRSTATSVADHGDYPPPPEQASTLTPSQAS